MSGVDFEIWGDDLQKIIDAKLNSHKNQWTVKINGLAVPKPKKTACVLSL